MIFSNTLLVTLLFAITAIAHPGPHANIGRSEFQRRDGMAKRCAGAAAAMNKKRFNKRAAKKRSLPSRGNATFQITTEAPYYDVIQNNTCILTPEVTQGPYVWPRSQTLRQDMREDQIGTPLTLDVGVLDMATCLPLQNALVDFWHCNATGSYSSFTERSPNTPFIDLLEALNITSTYQIGVDDLHTDDTTWLRGMWPTDSSGMMEMKTIYPGFYIQRAIHIHAQVHTNWVLNSNGTIVSSDIVSTGQLYIPEEINVEMMKLEPYVSHTQINRTTNAEDLLLPWSERDRYSPYMSLVAEDGVCMANGVIGYITIGVDTTAIETGDFGHADGT